MLIMQKTEYYKKNQHLFYDKTWQLKLKYLKHNFQLLNKSFSFFSTNVSLNQLLV